MSSTNGKTPGPRVEVGLAGKDGRRTLIFFLGDREVHRDRIDTDNENFRDQAINKFFEVSKADGANGNPEKLRRIAHLDIVNKAKQADSGGCVNSQLSTVKDAPPAARPFPVDSLPETVGRFVSETATAIGCDVSFVFLPLLACLARAIGNTRAIRLKQTWMELPIVWTAIVGKSGTHKSPALRSVMVLLEKKQEQSIKQYEKDLEKYAEERARYDRNYSQWKSRRNSDDPPPWEPPAPVCHRFLVSDTTIEALAPILKDQFDGVLLYRDELAGWLDGMNQYKGGKGSDTGHWLACWAGAPMTVDRKTGAIKFIHVPRASVCITGGIQPGIMRRALGREHLQDGMCARLLLAMPKLGPVRWTEAVPPPETVAQMNKVFDRLLALEPAADAKGNDTPFPIDLSPEAKAAWIDRYNAHREEQADLDDDLSAAWSKLEAYTARFALIFQLCSWAEGSASDEMIDEEAMRSAIAVSDWFGSEARRVYGVLAESDEDQERRDLIELIRSKGGSISIRDLMRCRPRQYPTSADAETAIHALFKAGLGAWRDVPAGPKGGQPTRQFEIKGVDS